MRKISVLSFFLFVFTDAFCQQFLKKEMDPELFIQQLFQNQDDLPYEDLYESLLQYYQSPIDLNKTTREELASLYILSELQINKLIEYKESQEEFISIYELQVIEGLDLNTIYKILPFVQVDNAINYKSIISNIVQGDHQFFLRYERVSEKRRGDEEGEKGYQGSPEKIMGKFKASHSKDYSLGFTFEKDAGEKIAWNPSKQIYGMDYLSGHISFQNKGHFKSIVLGDYQLQLGQGLIAGAGYFPGKGAETVAILRRYQTGARPYTSVNESGFFRGGSATYFLGPFDITAFYSSLNEDASIKKDSLNEEYTTSIQISGLHRTSSELAGRRNFNHKAFGSNLNFTYMGFQAGATFVKTSYESSVIKKATSYNQFEFRGKSNYVYSLHYSYIFQNFNLFGEVGRSESGGSGVVSGAIASLSSKVDAALVYRNYSRDFHSFYGNAFGESTRNINEEGLYVGIKLVPIRRVIFNAYFDRYHKPWLSFKAHAPSDGFEYLSRLSYLPSKTIHLYFQFRKENKEKNSKGEDIGFASLKEEQISTFLINVDFKPYKTLQLKSRFQTTRVSQESYKSTGMVLFQDIVLEKGKFKFSGRFAIFDTDDYESRQYTYEKDLLYAFSIPALSGEGVRNYLMIEYNLNRSVDIWLRASRTSYNDVDAIGSGLDMIQGNKKTDIKFQVRYKL